MTTQINWSISQLERNLPEQVALTAHWRCTGTDGTFTGSVYGSQALPSNDPATPGFVPYEQITEALALQWLHEAMDVEQVLAHEANVQAQIDKQANPMQAVGTPW